jgi:hypothetical protein
MKQPQRCSSINSTSIDSRNQTLYHFNFEGFEEVTDVVSSENLPKIVLTTALLVPFELYFASVEMWCLGLLAPVD